MSTRGNVIFVNSWTIEELNKYFEIDYIQALTTKKEESEVLKDSYKVYIHSDMYPSGFLPELQAFLQMDGAKYRCEDTSYLSAWFTCFKCMHMIPYTRAMGSEDRIEPDKVEPNLENMEKSKDWFGIGLEHELADDANYTYVIVPQTNGKYTHDASFDIYIFEGPLYEFIDKVNSEDTPEIWECKYWWD